MATRAIDTTERKRRGARLTEFRGWLGLTQGELAEWISGTTTAKSTITHAEQGTRPVPVERLNELFGVSYDWLMGYDDEMWGPSVQAIRRRLSVWLSNLPPEQNRLLMHPGARIVASYREIQQVSSLLTDQYAAVILNIDLAQWLEVLADETYVSTEQWKRWAEWTGLSEKWLGKGELPPQPDERDQAEPFIPVFREAVRMGITPEKLLAMIKVYGQ